MTLIEQILKEGFWGTAGAGVLIICVKTKRALIGLRSAYVKEPGTWNLFGGAIDAGEDPGEAARREAEEELGYQGSMRLVPAYVFSSGSFKYYNFIGLVAEEFEPQLNWETDKVKWVTYQELLKIRGMHFGLKGLLNNSSDIIQKYM